MMEEQWEDFTPETHLIQSVRRRNHTWPVIIGELVDNGFDAGATRIDIVFDKNSLTVSDDGKGCAVLKKFVQLGGHHQQDTTQLGINGVGAKEAVICAADKVEISSVCRGVLRVASCDFRAIERSGRWAWRKPTEEPTNDASGTSLRMCPIRKERVNLQNLMKSLSKSYFPAIRDGRQIRVLHNGKSDLVSLYHLPRMDDRIEHEIVVGKKRARFVAGLTPQGERTETGWMVSFGFRVMPRQSYIGLPNGEPIPGLFGSLELLSGWTLTTNKTDVIGIADIESRIASLAAPLIVKAEKQQRELMFPDVERDLEKLLQILGGGGMARRNSPKNESGAIIPRGVRVHRKAKRVQPGETLDAIKRRGIKLCLKPLEPDGPMWEVRENLVILNSANPLISPNDRKTIMSLAVSALVTSIWLSGEQQKFPIMREYDTITQAIPAVIGKLLHSVARTEINLLAEDAV